MTIKRGTTGSGFTEKPTISWDSEADESNPEIAASIERGTLSGWLASVERECFAIMEGAGLPTYHGCFMFNAEGEWHDPRPPFLGSGKRLANEIWPVAKARGYSPDSEVGFAARMLGDVVWCRRARERGDHDRASLFTGYLKAKEVERRLKREREQMWQRGVDDQRSRASGGQATRKTPDVVRVDRWRHYFNLTGKRTEADRLAAEELGEGESTIRAARRKAASASD